MTEENIKTEQNLPIKSWLVGLTASTIILLAISVYLLIATSGTDKSGMKIGYIRSEQVLQQYKPAIAVQQQLQKETEEAQKDLEKRYNELQVMDADIKKKSAVLTMQALSPQIEKMQRKQNEFLQLQQSLQQQMSRKQAELLEPIFQDISNFINKYGRDNGYMLILGTPVEGMIVYGDPGKDLTDIIVTELNSRVPPSLPYSAPSEKDSLKK